MKNHYTALALFVLASSAIKAQSYCSPDFTFGGCINWHNISISAGDINWSLGASPCGTSDYTNLSTTVNAGDDLPMTVINGVWCGCAVWVDFDNSTSFEDSENLYYIYVGNDPSYTYTFSISVPSGTPSGSYRMRVISPWGSDGFLNTNANGYGPCGTYQYGNFTDLTLNVSGSNSVADLDPAAFSIAPNPAAENTVITRASSIGELTVTDAQGRVVEQRRVPGDRTTLDTQEWAKGIYVVQLRNEEGLCAQRLIVE